MKKLQLKHILSIIGLVLWFGYLAFKPSNKVDSCDGFKQRDAVRSHFKSLAGKQEILSLEGQNECSHKWYALGYNESTQLYVHADYITDGSSGKIKIVDLKVSESAFPIR